MNLSASQLFSRRLAYWTGQGFSGPAVYEQLAQDEELPAAFDPADAADILGVRPLSLKKQRLRSAGPDFIRVSARAVQYPRQALCMHLAKRYVKVAA